MLIHELSKLTGISTHTIRFYEKSGLIKGRRDESITSNNYFHYDEEAVEKLELIRDAKSIGFTINEIGQLMEAWYNNTMTIPEKIAVLDEKLLCIEQKIKQLREMKKMIALFKEDIIKDDC